MGIYLAALANRLLERLQYRDTERVYIGPKIPRVSKC